MLFFFLDNVNVRILIYNLINQIYRLKKKLFVTFNPSLHHIFLTPQHKVAGHVSKYKKDYEQPCLICITGQIPNININTYL